MCVCVCVCVCIYIYTHTHTHRERERERDRLTDLRGYIKFAKMAVPANYTFYLKNIYYKNYAFNYSPVKKEIQPKRCRNY